MGVSTDYDSPDVPVDRMLAWNADETGVYVKDVSNNNRDLLLTSGNEVSRVAGHTGNGLQQTTTGITYGPDPVPLMTPNLTVMMWLRINAVGTFWVSEFYRSTLLPGPNDTGLFGILCATAPRWRIKNPSNVATDIAFPDDIGNWHHIAVVWDGTSIFLYRDAVIVNAGGTVVPGGMWTGADVYRVFDGTGSNATIDDVQIFRSVKSASEIATLMASPA